MKHYPLLDTTAETRGLDPAGLQERGQVCGRRGPCLAKQHTLFEWKENP